MRLKDDVGICGHDNFRLRKFYQLVDDARFAGSVFKSYQLQIGIFTGKVQDDFIGSVAAFIAANQHTQFICRVIGVEDAQ